MSLFSSIRMAANTLRAMDISLQVTGQNIANANTPGYIREDVILAPSPTQRVGGLLLGTGVDVEAVVQKIDHFLEERLRGSVSDRMDAETQESSYQQLEGVIGELSDTDLSTALNTFFSGIAEILNQPESVSVRNLAVLQGGTLTDGINRMAERVSTIRADTNDRIIDMADSINRLVEQIRELNVRIANTEGGDVSRSDAVGLRDQRLQAMEDLAKLIDIRVREQPSGAVVVYSGSDFLVFEGIAREVEVVLDSDRGLSVADIHMVNTDAPIDPAAGELRGLLDSRDNIMGDFLDQLDEFARTLAFEFNKIYSSGQGLNGYGALTSEFAVDDINEPLNDAGLQFTPVNGSFQVLVHNRQTGETQTTDIFVDLNGLGNDITLDGTTGPSLTAMLDDIDGISASTNSGKLTITSDSPDHEFTFANDTSGLLAALGLNTFFSGYNAASLGVNAVLQHDPATFAASNAGIGADTGNAIELAVFLDHPIQSQNNETLAVMYDRMIGETTQAASITRAVADGARVFEDTLRGQKLAVSGVSLDEEAVRMISYQRSYQASARYIATLNELFGVLVSI
ncbi:MAG: flagellar hook-associated protein FlgK [Pirellulales bacterium]|nr:flagellar hook-associated protein FlgK [Pirellulales bacterium]